MGLLVDGGEPRCCCASPQQIGAPIHRLYRMEDWALFYRTRRVPPSRVWRCLGTTAAANIATAKRASKGSSTASTNQPGNLQWRAPRERVLTPAEDMGRSGSLRLARKYPAPLPLAIVYAPMSQTVGQCHDRPTQLLAAGSPPRHPVRVREHALQKRL